MSIEDECAKAGQRMGARLYQAGTRLSQALTKKEKVVFWSSILNELSDTVNEPRLANDIIKNEWSDLGKRMAGTLRVLGESLSVDMNAKEKKEFWHALLCEIARVFDDLASDDVHNNTRH